MIGHCSLQADSELDGMSKSFCWYLRGFLPLLSQGCKVDHQPAGNGEKDGTVATKNVTDKVKTGRLQ